MHISAPFIRRPVAHFAAHAALLLAGAVGYRCFRFLPARRLSFPPSACQAQSARRQPRNHGLRGRNAPRAPVRPHRRRTEMTSSRRWAAPTSRCSSISTATSMPPRATSRPPSTRPAAQLPANMPKIRRYRKVNPADAPIMILALTSDTLTRPQMYDAADSILAQKISQVRGRRTGLRRRRCRTRGSR